MFELACPQTLKTQTVVVVVVVGLIQLAPITAASACEVATLPLGRICGT